MAVRQGLAGSGSKIGAGQSAQKNLQTQYCKCKNRYCADATTVPGFRAIICTEHHPPQQTEHGKPTCEVAHHDGGAVQAAGANTQDGQKHSQAEQGE